MSKDRNALRWNGWGSNAEKFDLGERADAVWSWLADAVGLERLVDRPACALSDVQLPAPRLPEGALARLRGIVGEGGIETSDYERAFPARGRSYPDLLDLRAGTLDPAPDAVVYPACEQHVVDLVALAAELGVALVPFGGGSSVVGGVTALAGEDHVGVVTVDTTRLDRVLSVDEVSRTARIEAGIYGPELERELQSRGFTLGHYPQSFEYSTLGGWIAARGAGQQSNRYGKAEEWLVGATVVTPGGRWQTESFPASAAGPLLRDLVPGSEGILGIITEATVRVHPTPEAVDRRGYLFPDFERGLAAVREIQQEGLPVAMIRLSDPDETRFLGAFSQLRKPPGTVQRVADELLERTGWGEERSMMLLGVEGDASNVKAALSTAAAIVRSHRGFPLGTSAGRSWTKSRFKMPYLRDPLLDRGIAVDTLETSTSWSKVPALHRAVTRAIQGALERERATPQARAMVMCHVSHVYEDGASLYFTFVFPQRAEGALEQWRAVKQAAGDAIAEGGGTISHHHGVGTDHAPWLRREKGDVAMAVLGAVKHELDPKGVLNPRKLLT